MTVLELRNISKNFGAIQAVNNVSFTLEPGEVVGLMGDNGAGKSTLVKMIAGNFRPSAGHLLMDGTEVAMTLREDEVTKNIPIFFITALIAPWDKIEVAGTANSPVFAKPVNLSELLIKIQQQIGV